MTTSACRALSPALTAYAPSSAFIVPSCPTSPEPPAVFSSYNGDAGKACIRSPMSTRSGWVDAADQPGTCRHSVRWRTGVAQLVDYSVMTATPIVSMLWESVDPSVALLERFGFVDAVSAVGWMGDTLCDTWAIAIHDCERLVISDRNLLAWITLDDGRLIAKSSVSPPRFQRLADTATLRMWLQTAGIPVAAPIPTRDGRLQVELNNVSLGVCPVIEGDLLDIGDPAQVTEAGQMLATLHDALGNLPPPHRRRPADRSAAACPQRFPVGQHPPRQHEHHGGP